MAIMVTIRPHNEDKTAKDNKTTTNTNLATNKPLNHRKNQSTPTSNILKHNSTQPRPTRPGCVTTSNPNPLLLYRLPFLRLLSFFLDLDRTTLPDPASKRTRSLLSCGCIKLWGLACVGPKGFHLTKNRLSYHLCTVNNVSRCSGTIPIQFVQD